jgi:transposase
LGEQRRTYTKEFKIEAVRLVTEGGHKPSEVARDLGIHECLLGRWRKEIEQGRTGAFPGKGKLRPEQEELRRLQRELARVTEEREILKKALAIFSKGPK